MSLYTHVDGGEYRRLPGNYRLKLSGDTEWRPVVVYKLFESDPQPCTPQEERFYVTDEARWAARFRERPPPTEAEWAEIRRGLVVDWSVLYDSDDSDDSDEDTEKDEAFRRLLELTRDLATEDSVGGINPYTAQIDALERAYRGEGG